ncbi:MAG: hypothetical protein RMM17_03655 [Acidobacteriota bacterium]|nr:hypothetical protein [Blastocatellia bacterium]MDW8411764.1 hypothetical protein [Acidobacteriota bacterium]
MRVSALLISLLTLVAYAEDKETYLTKRLIFLHVNEAKQALHQRALEPPIKPGTPRQVVHKILGIPKEVIGYGEEVYKLKDATLSLSYSADVKGEIVVAGVIYQLKKPVPWSMWLKPTVELPKSGHTDKKLLKLVRISLQVRIQQYLEQNSLQITLMGTEQNLTSVSWSLVL